MTKTEREAHNQAIQQALDALSELHSNNSVGVDTSPADAFDAALIEARDAIEDLIEEED